MISAPRVRFHVESAFNPAIRDSLWEVVKVAMAEGYFKDPVKDQSLIHSK